MKAIEFLFFLLGCLIALFLLLAIEIIFFFKPKEKEVFEKPVLKIDHSIVPSSFLKTFRVWDESLYQNKIIIEA